MVIKTPLRYPGGKTRATKFLDKYIDKAKEFREPFVGGGSVFLNQYNSNKFKKYWINDINRPLYSFWKSSILNNSELIGFIKNHYDEKGKDYFYKLKDITYDNIIEEGARFFAINRMSFSGTAESGGFSKASCDGRFTESSIHRVSNLSNLKNVKITNLDYSKLLSKEGENVFIYLDPPYYSAEKSKLYGKNGNLHSGFDHKLLRDRLYECKHDWIMTYDNSEYIRELYNEFYILEFSLNYSMSGEKKADNNELLISNKPLSKV